MRFHINERLVDVKTGEIFYGDSRTLLEPKVRNVLAALVNAQGSVLSYQELIELVWADTVVEPNALQRCVTHLRKALGDDGKTIIETFPKLGYRLNPTRLSSAPRQYKRVAIMIGTLLVFAVAFLSGTTFEKHAPSLSIESIEPLTFKSQYQHGASFHQNSLIYIEQDNDKHLLVLKNIDTQKTQILYSSHQLYGGTSLNPEGTLILFSEVQFVNKVKCAQVRMYSLLNNKSHVVIPCTNNFNHGAKWLNNDQFIYLKTNKSQQNSVYAYDFSAREPVQIDLTQQANLDQIANLNVSSGQILLGGTDHQGQTGIWLGRLENNSFLTTSFYPSTYAQSGASNAVINRKGEIFQTHEHKLFRYIHSESNIQNVVIPRTEKFDLIAALDNNTLLAQASINPWQINERQWDSDKFFDKPLFSTQYSQTMGQYSPNDDSIAFISTRSGQNQIWLSKNGELRQLTHKQPVSSFIWKVDGKGLWFISNSSLYEFDLSTYKIRNLTSPAVDTLMQHSAKGWLLMRHAETYEPLLLTLDSLTTKPLINAKVGWAQLTERNQLIFNPKGIGKLMVSSLDEPNSPAAELFPDITIQSRYYLRSEQLYTQDKATRIWAINTSNFSREKIATFDENALFATDVKTAPFRMLSDNYAPKRSDIVKLVVKDVQDGVE